MEVIEITIEEEVTDLTVVIEQQNEVVNIEVGSIDGGSGLAVSDFVINEVPTGVLNSSNALFTSLQEFIPETLEVMVNGLTMKKVTDYNTIGRTQIQLNFSPSVNEIITLNYIKY